MIIGLNRNLPDGLTALPPCRNSDCAPSADQSQQNDDDGHYQKDMNEAIDREGRHESQDPKQDQNDCNHLEHLKVSQ